jgi:hypothetical protein
LFLFGVFVSLFLLSFHLFASIIPFYCFCYTVFAFVLFQFVHQRAPEAVMTHLANEARAGALGGGGVLFLTPCHTTPFNTHIHHPVATPNGTTIK